jgi:hypothetical protein
VILSWASRFDITIHWRMTAEQFLGRKKEESA